MRLPDPGEGVQTAVSRPRPPVANPLARFLAKCRFNACTGCVEWIGGKTRGRGKTRWYGSFWYGGKRWLAHRWAALHIHGIEIAGMDVDHKCTNTLCVRHLQAVPQSVNTALYWIRAEVGLEPYQDEPEVDSEGVPFYLPPVWLPHDPAPPGCPF